MTRRDLLRRSAVLGGGLAVASPAIQSLARPAFAASGEGGGLDIALVVIMQRRPAPRAPWQDLSDHCYRLRFNGGICVTPALDVACGLPAWEWSGLPGHASSALPVDARFPGASPTIAVSHDGGVLRIDLSPATFQSDVRHWDYRFVVDSMAPDGDASPERTDDAAPGDEAAACEAERSESAEPDAADPDPAVPDPEAAPVAEASSAAPDAADAEEALEGR